MDFNKQTIGGEAILHFEIVAKEIEHIVSTVQYNTMRQNVKNDIVCVSHFIRCPFFAAE